MIEPRETIKFLYLRLRCVDDYRDNIEERWHPHTTKGSYVLMYEPSRISIIYIHKTIRK